MKVSFLVTYYNQKDFVKPSLDSILAIEKPCDWEIIVGDDGSNDGTVDVVNDYVKKYPNNIKIYSMPRENGRKYDSLKRASANRINLLKKSKGDFFCIIDGDDFYCDTSFVKEAIEIFKANDNVSIVMFGHREFKNGFWGEECTFPKENLNGIVKKEKYLEKYYIHSGACVYKKNFDNLRVNYISNLGYYDDNDIVINNLNYGDIYSIKKIIYAYRQTGDGIFTSMNFLEKALLNVKGFDVDNKLIDNRYEKFLIKRNSISILTAFIWKNYFPKILGDNKYNKYINSITINDFLSYSITNYNDICNSDRKNVDYIIKKCIFYNWKFYIKEKIKYVRR